MKEAYQIGDLVHIPQAVKLLDWCTPVDEQGQLAIPSRVKLTHAPTLGVVTQYTQCGYIQVFCDGTNWSVLNSNVYKVNSSNG